MMSARRVALWLVLAFVASAGGASAQTTRSWMSWDEAYPMMYGPWHMGCSVLWLLGIVVIVTILVVLWRRSAPRDDAQTILRARFARGDIDREEYFRRKADLDRGGA